ncbi:MAG: LamG domain-containing protein [Candidatus Sericytochromatia bacterium]|nr:LamG domain-containing protein [Candidatus Sericytochromatia bacterium]
MPKNKSVIVLLCLLATACTVNVNNTPANPAPSAAPSAMPSAAPSSTPDNGSSTPTPTPTPEVSTAGLIEYLDFSAAPPAEQTGLSATPDRLAQADQAWRFSGESNSFYRVDRDINGTTLPQATFSAWVRTAGENGVDQGHIISPDNANTSRMLYFTSSSGSPLWHAGTGPSSDDLSTQALVNRWQLLTVTYDDSSNTVALYVDGNLRASTTELAPRNGYDYFHIGNSPFSGKFFVGDIDEVRVYNRVLSDSEIQQLYLASKDR